MDSAAERRSSVCMEGSVMHPASVSRSQIRDVLCARRRQRSHTMSKSQCIENNVRIKKHKVQAHQSGRERRATPPTKLKHTLNHISNTSLHNIQNDSLPTLIAPSTLPHGHTCTNRNIRRDNIGSRIQQFRNQSLGPRSTADVISTSQY